MPDPAKTLADTNPRRLNLLTTVTADRLRWRPVPLADGWAVEVCDPVKVGGVFLPATAGESATLARAFGALPLTRAVADRVLVAARRAGGFVPFRGFYPHLFDYDRFTAWLDTTAYSGRGPGWGFGAHKLWVLSRHPNAGAVNYGFFTPATDALKPGGGGPGLPADVHVVQALGGRHTAAHWDYSQLLQFMRNLTGPGGGRRDLRAELLAGHPAVWDEAGAKLRPQDLP